MAEQEGLALGHIAIRMPAVNGEIKSLVIPNVCSVSLGSHPAAADVVPRLKHWQISAAQDLDCSDAVVVSRTSRELLAPLVVSVERAAWSGSNDAEIAALRAALGAALRLLGLGDLDA